MNPESLKKRTVPSSSQESETSIPMDNNNNNTGAIGRSVKRLVWEKEDTVQWDQEKTMAFNEKARWFAIFFSIMIDIVLCYYILEDAIPKTDNQVIIKAKMTAKFILIGALALLLLMQAVYTCLISMWPVNMLLERILLSYSCFIAGAVSYSLIFQLLTNGNALL
jgi:hypothetical protein